MDADRHQIRRISLIVGSTAVVIWAYWTSLVEIVDRWSTDPQYSHGFIVPIFAGYLLWARRGHYFATDFQPRWWGLAIVLAAFAARLLAHFFYQPWLDTGSLLICLTGLAAAAGGRRALLWAGPAILFSAFMLPLPYRTHLMLGGMLQRIATLASTYALQTLGVSAVSEGNVILLSNTRLGVVEACSGLSMTVTFFALATAVAILAPRSWFERAVIVASAIPIAIVANVARITITGLLFEASRDDLAKIVFHDLAGWLMMPLALVILLGELYVLGKAIVPIGVPERQFAPAVA